MGSLQENVGHAVSIQVNECIRMRDGEQVIWLWVVAPQILAAFYEEIGEWLEFKLFSFFIATHRNHNSGR